MGQEQNECAGAAGLGRGGEEVDARRLCSPERQRAGLLSDSFLIPIPMSPTGLFALMF